MPADIEGLSPTDGYASAFYEIADMLGISARTQSPAIVWVNEMRPKIAALTRQREQNEMLVRELKSADLWLTEYLSRQPKPGGLRGGLLCWADQLAESLKAALSNTNDMADARPVPPAEAIPWFLDVTRQPPPFSHFKPQEQWNDAECREYGAWQDEQTAADARESGT